jgi:hypothetical protein
MSSELNEKIVEQWERVKLLLSSAEEDVLKNARGNNSAGVRARKVLRELRRETHSLVRLTVTEAAAAKAAAPAKE